jgi:hypothetical protein
LKKTGSERSLAREAAIGYAFGFLEPKNPEKDTLEEEGSRP